MNTTELFVTSDPQGFYKHHQAHLDEVGARAFGKPVEVFGPDVGNHFSDAEFAHIMVQGRRSIVGFALYKMLAGHLWRRCTA